MHHIVLYKVKHDLPPFGGYEYPTVALIVSDINPSFMPKQGGEITVLITKCWVSVLKVVDGIFLCVTKKHIEELV